MPLPTNARERCGLRNPPSVPTFGPVPHKQTLVFLSGAYVFPAEARLSAGSLLLLHLPSAPPHAISDLRAVLGDETRLVANTPPLTDLG